MALIERQRNHTQIKGDLWDIVSTMKLQVLNKHKGHNQRGLPFKSRDDTSCQAHDIAMIRWITYVKLMNLEICHMDMLSQHIKEKVKCC